MKMKKLRFESDLARQLYTETTALARLDNLKRDYISQDFIWKLWQKTYKTNCGCKRFYLLPEQWRQREDL